MTREIMVWPERWESLTGKKAERYITLWADGYASGDVLLLREYNPDEQTYTGREHRRTIVSVNHAVRPASWERDVVVELGPA